MNKYSSRPGGRRGGDRLCRAGAPPPARAAPAADVRHRDGVRGVGVAAAARAGKDLGCAGRAVWMSTARRRRPTPCSSALPDTLAAEIAPGARGARHPRVRSVRRLPAPRRGAPAALVSALAGDDGRRRLRPDRAAPARARGARLVACPGCYPTAAVLALQPLVDGGLLEPGIIIDAKSGISGAGKTPTERTHFSESHDSISAYGVFGHRHGAEIEQELGVPVTFVPHLVPLDRGHPRDDLRAAAAGRGRGGGRSGARRAPTPSSPFVRLTGARLPEIKHVAHTNFCDIGWRVDAPGGQLVMVVVHRQPRQGRGRPGDPELQRRVRLRRNDGAALEIRSMITVLKLGGELLEDAAAMQSAAAAIVALARPARSSSCTAAGARSTPSSAPAARSPASSTACASRMRRRSTPSSASSPGGPTRRWSRRSARAGARAVGLTGADGGIGRSVRAGVVHQRSAASRSTWGSSGSPDGTDVVAAAPTCSRSATCRSLRASGVDRATARC